MPVRLPQSLLNHLSGARRQESTAVAVAAAPDAGAALINLLPVPAVVLQQSGSVLSVVAMNQPLRALGLGGAGDAAPLIAHIGQRISDFLASGDPADGFIWQHGDTVDCRHYQVHMARSGGAAVAQGDRCLVTLIDCTGERRTEQNLRREMLTDALSGLPNREGFVEALETLIAAPSVDKERYAVMIVNLDRFNRVNACLGSLAGDELLITVARRIRGALRGSDVLARIGGDEFAIMVTLDQGRQDADHLAKRVLGALANPFRLSDFEIRVSCWIGVAFGGDPVDDAEDLVRHAQFAAKRSKASGEVEAYQPQAFDRARAEFGLETALRRAIDAQTLKLAYQPIVDLATGRVVAFEALTRWQNDAGLEVGPGAFIPVAEESGLIVPLGRWALREAATTLAGWDARGADRSIKMAVNVSAIQLQRDNVPQLVKQALEVTGLGGNRLTLELTESALIADPDRIAQIMQALKSLDVTLAMDDFGTGYSNLANLQKLPIDVLKMDRSFVTGMLADRDKIAITRAILSLAQALGMKTTAEGVETHELAQTLAALGCTYAQGYYYGRAVSADEAYALVEARNA